MERSATMSSRIEWAHRGAVLLLALGGLTGCGLGQSIEVASRSDALSDWSLLADASDVLRDSAHPRTAYPNPKGCSELLVRVERDGRLCALCSREGGGRRRFCGGPGAGIPYLLHPSTEAGQLDLEVRDIFGRVARELKGMTDLCVTVDQSSGVPCEICADEAGAVSVRQGCEEVISEEQVPGADAGSGEDGGSTAMSADECLEAGARAYIDNLDAELARVGLPDSGLEVEETLGMLDDREDGFCGFSDPFGDEGFDGAEWGGDDDRGEVEILNREGELRCATVGSLALNGTCPALPPECAEYAVPYEEGVGAAYIAWIIGSSEGGTDEFEGMGEVPTINPELPECTGSPLVVDVAGTGVELSSHEAGATFDLLGTGRAVATGWVASGALLAIDLDADGRISSGRELFGEATRLASGAPARDGFAALAQYDTPAQGGNSDGVIDRRDRAFGQLLLWLDEGHDGESRPRELVRVTDTGIRALGLSHFTPEIPFLLQGNEVGSVGTVEWSDGSQSDLLDVWFSYRPLLAPTS